MSVRPAVDSQPFSFPTEASRSLFTRLERCLPGGDTRTTAFFAPYPLAFAGGSGCRLRDVDGNEFVDFVNSYAILVHGHSRPEVVDALVSALPDGTGFSGPTVHQAELAERLVDRFAAIDSLRFTASGNEAVMLAVRAARMFTGRSGVVKADGAYHGSWEQVPMSLAAPKWTLGVPDELRALLHPVTFNDVEALAATMEEHGGGIAAILLEPVLYAGGIIPGAREYFEAARELADEHGALLVVDEVITSRLRWGGYLDELRVRPDLTTLGKSIGGGLPIGVVGGREEIMGMFDPRRGDHAAQAGSYNGNPLSMVAGVATLDLLTRDEIERINGLGERLAKTLRAAFARSGLPVVVNSCGSLLQLHFETGSAEVTSFGELNLESPALARFHRALLEEGIYAAPRGMLNVSTAMDESVIDEAAAGMVRAAERAFEAADG
jgi:glutamate-1-semialdehyde 2,1-aminomutase